MTVAAVAARAWPVRRPTAAPGRAAPRADRAVGVGARLQVSEHIGEPAGDAHPDHHPGPDRQRSQQRDRIGLGADHWTVVLTGLPSWTVRLTVHNRSSDRRTASGRTALAASPPAPSGNATRKVSAMSVNRLPPASRILCAVHGDRELVRLRAARGDRVHVHAGAGADRREQQFHRRERRRRVGRDVKGAAADVRRAERAGAGALEIDGTQGVRMPSDQSAPRSPGR